MWWACTTRSKSPLSPPLSGCRCKLAALKARRISSCVALGSTKRVIDARALARLRAGMVAAYGLLPRG
eukprot:CAMPEP_0115718682 /NCGR_PEP_ID=MMETSP0272-20121206/77567_1 /TAXON_ID=71861 /ORGANISM="Scrippsiella trochoidea, Strain CCMP3099" /LENGTH=67 /DNA_ID=CAMNT_0003161239 /DNA_START=183 /DNA_END=383 /DNA_ORIENTATION=-